MTTHTAIPSPVTEPASLREARPFAWLEPASSLSTAAIRGTADLRHLAAGSLDVLVRSVVEFSLRSEGPLDLVSRRRQHPVSVRNRRLRAAKLWLLAILDGRCDSSTVHALTRTWLPQLTGSGPDIRIAARRGRRFVEFVRGAVSADLFAAPDENLVPNARALGALEGVLAVHLHAIDRAARR